MARIPQGCAEIDAAWLNEVLDAAQRGGATVVGVETTVIGEGVGFLGEVARVTLAYDRDDHDGVRSLIAKVPTTNPGFKHMGLLLGFYRKEHGFYSEVAGEVTIPIPRSLHHDADLDAGDFVLLLEDMAPLRAGNQLEGCSREEAETALRTIATFHAHWWEHPRLDEFSSWLPGPGDPYFAMLKGAYDGGLAKFEEVFGHLVTPDIVELANRYAEEYDTAIDKGAGRRPHTFIHGDYRLDNMMFGDGGDVGEAGAFAVLDWQLPFRANPLWDVVYFLAGNFEPEFRREHQHELVKSYHDALMVAGVRDYTFEQCWDDYRAAGLVLVGYLVTGAADIDLSSLNERGRELMETMFHRYSLAITDLGSGAYLD